MKICILYHSQSGVTESFANVLQEVLQKAGHSVACLKLATLNPVKQASVRDKQEIKITNLPDPEAYDMIMFGGPVWAFGPSPVIVAAIKQMEHLQGKKCCSFVTMGFPFRWMGGNAAIGYMARELRAKGAIPQASAICTRFSKDLKVSMQSRAKELISQLG